MQPELVTAITALVVALTTLMTTAVTLIKVFQHGAVIEATRDAVNGQASELHNVTTRNAAGLDRIDAQVTRMEVANDTAARAKVVP
jgi:Trk-type K+ transport system membrane component